MNSSRCRRASSSFCSIGIGPGSGRAIRTSIMPTSANDTSARQVAAVASRVDQRLDRLGRSRRGPAATSGSSRSSTPEHLRHHGRDPQLERRPEVGGQRLERRPRPRRPARPPAGCGAARRRRPPAAATRGRGSAGRASRCPPPPGGRPPPAARRRPSPRPGRGRRRGVARGCAGRRLASPWAHRTVEAETILPLTPTPEGPMSVEFNHTIVHVSDRDAAAREVAEILGLAAPATYGPFAVLELDNGASLDFMDDRGDFPASTSRSSSTRRRSTRSTSGSAAVVASGGPTRSTAGRRRSTPTTAAAASTGRARTATTSRSSPGRTAAVPSARIALAQDQLGDPPQVLRQVALRSTRRNSPSTSNS